MKRAGSRFTSSANRVIVVGAGHNGLTAACYLARAGVEVEVIEAAANIGGCTTSGPISGAPAHTVSPCAGDIITMRVSTVIDDLQLRRFGYSEQDVDPAYCAVGLDGASLAFWRDPRRTAAEIRRFSPRDATAFLTMIRDLDAALDAMLPMLAQNPKRPEPGALGAAARAAGRHPKRLANVLALATQTAAEAIAARFEHPLVRAGIGMQANFGSPITGAGSGVNWRCSHCWQRIGMGRPDGGMQAVPNALAACLHHHGGTIRTASPVEEILLDDSGVPPA